MPSTLSPSSLLLLLLLIVDAAAFRWSPHSGRREKVFTSLQVKNVRNQFVELIDRLGTAATSRTVEKALVIEAIDKIEGGLSYLPRIDPSALRGEWELVFSSLIGPGYFPITEVCDFYKFSLKSSWGTLPLGSFEGSSRLASEKPLVRATFIPHQNMNNGININIYAAFLTR